MLAKSRCSELEQTLMDKEMMISAMESHVEELKEKNLVLSKKATEAEEMKHGYKIMKEKAAGLFHKVYTITKTMNCVKLYYNVIELYSGFKQKTKCQKFY